MTNTPDEASQPENLSSSDQAGERFDEAVETFYDSARMSQEDQPDGGDTWHIAKKDLNAYKAAIRQAAESLAEARVREELEILQRILVPNQVLSVQECLRLRLNDLASHPGEEGMDE